MYYSNFALPPTMKASDEKPPLAGIIWILIHNACDVSWDLVTFIFAVPYVSFPFNTRYNEWNKL